MPLPQTLAALLAGAREAAEEEARIEARQAARAARARQTMAVLKIAQVEAEAAWRRLIDRLPEDMDEEEWDAVPPPPEQAVLDFLLAEIRAICEHDKWPREMYFKNV